MPPRKKPTIAAKDPKNKKASQATGRRGAKHGQTDHTDHEEAGQSGEGGRFVVGSRLINMIRKRLIELDLPDRHIADIIGVTTIYWNSMANGNRQIRALSKEKMERIADFLGIPTVQAMAMADFLEPKDFFVGSLEDQLVAAVEKMRNDPVWMGWAPTHEEWRSLSISTRVGIVMLYETVYQKMLLRRAEVEHPEMAEAMQNASKKTK